MAIDFAFNVKFEKRDTTSVKAAVITQFDFPETTKSSDSPLNSNIMT